jgi:hypothetical protein
MGSAQYAKNVKPVRYSGHEGLDAELALMRDAWRVFRHAETARTLTLAS